MFDLTNITAQECATTLIEEIFLRYGVPRRLISDNGPQFLSAVLQQFCYILGTDQLLTPLYHPQTNPVERKNRDLKPRIAILVGNQYSSWIDNLPFIRFIINSAKSDTTGQTVAYLQFDLELKTIDEVVNDFKTVVENNNFFKYILKIFF